MHYPGTPQKFLTNLLLMFTAGELIVAGLFYSYYGYFVVGQTKAIAAADAKSGVMWATFLLSLVFFGVAAFTSLVIKKSYNRCITTLYAFMLFTCLIIFGGIAAGGPMGRDAVAKEFDSQCKNVTSDIYKVDALYGIGNAQLCGASCPCAADPKLWEGYSSQKVDSKAQTTQNVLNNATGVTSAATTTTIVSSPTGAHNFPQCPGTSTTLQSFITANLSGSGSELKLGLGVLDAVERDFNCAGFCVNSKFFTFSEVSQGPPSQTCVKGINSAMDSAAKISMFSGVCFLIPTLVGFVVTFMLICNRFDPKGRNFNELNES